MHNYKDRNSLFKDNQKYLILQNKFKSNKLLNKLIKQNKNGKVLKMKLKNQNVLFPKNILNLTLKISMINKIIKLLNTQMRNHNKAKVEQVKKELIL